MTSVAALRAGDLVRIRGERWRLLRVVPYGSTACVDVEGADDGNRAQHARFLVPFERLERLVRATTPRVVTPARWRRAARQALAGSTPSWCALRAATRADLRLMPFQLEPALALVRGDACRFLIADSVGLGKTVQAGLMMAEVSARRPDARAIVVAPAGLMEQWRTELAGRFHLDAQVMDAACVGRIVSGLPPGINPWAAHPLVIASIDYVKRPEVIRSLEALFWDIVVFDEAHGLAGRSGRSAAADALASRSRIVVLLTATPHSGDDHAFERMCRIGSAAPEEPLLTFRRSPAVLTAVPRTRSVLLRIRPTPAEASMHQALQAYARLVWLQHGDRRPGARLAVSVLVRRAASSAASLARSIERRLTLLSDAPPGHGTQLELAFSFDSDRDEEPSDVLAAPGLPDLDDERRRLEHVLERARAATAAESKLVALRRLVARTGEPAIVFTEYRDTLHTLACALAGADAVQLHGGLARRERTAALTRFTGGSARLLLATDTASEGLNLHARCRLVISLELPWTPLRLVQRAGRVDRIGQTRRVHALHFVAAGTGEETVLARLAQRVARIHRAAGAFGVLPDERRVAESVLGSASLPAIPPAPSVAGAAVTVVDLRQEARAEADRIAGSRVLLDRRGGPADRPAVLTHIRCRRSPTASARCYWLFRLLVVAADRRLVTEELLALCGEGPRLRRSRAATRALLDPRQPRVREAVDRESRRRLDDLAATVSQPVARWTLRERALLDVLRARHARLAAGLRQRALFDRRLERLAAAQADVLREAATRADERLAQLSAWKHLDIEACELAVAAVFD